MALRFVDSFDHYPVTEIAHKWTPSSTMTFVTGRLGSVAAMSTNQRTNTKILDAQTEWVVGFAIQIGSNSGPIMRVMNGSTVQVDLYFDVTSGTIACRRAGTTTLGTSPDALPGAGIWTYLEFRVVLSDTVGVAHLKFDGVDQFNLTSQDTINSGATADRIRFGDGGATNVAVNVDDLYILDGTTGPGSNPMNDFLGDVHIEVLYPSGNGATSDFVGQDANSTDNYLNVDEVNSDDDTTYNESDVIGEKDTYAFADLAVAAGTVFAVALNPWARKTDSGARSVAGVTRVGGVEEDGDDAVLSTSYTYVTQDIRPEIPGGGDWTIADVNGAEFGVKVTA